MQTALRCAMVPALAVLVCAAAAFAMAPIDGRWTGRMNGPEGPIDLVLDLASNGEQLTGTASFAAMSFTLPISNGKVTADTDVSFDLVFEEMSFSLPFRGKLDGEILKLAVESPMGADSVSLTRVPAD